MNTKTIAIIAAVVVLAGGGYYFFTTNSPASERVTTGDVTGDGTSDVTAPRDSATGQASGRFSGTVGELVARGGNYKCSVYSGTTVSDSTGTVYVAGGQLKGDFTSDVNGTQTETHMVQTGGYMYVWTSAAPQGFKSKVAAGAFSGTTGTTGSYSNADQSYSYDCQPWSPSPSAFALPSGIQFIDPSSYSY